MIKTPKIGAIEYQVQKNFGMDILPFMEKWKNHRLSAVEIAEMIGCSVGNLRCTMRQFDFSFRTVKALPMLTECPKFQNKKMNATNCLSRRWVA